MLFHEKLISYISSRNTLILLTRKNNALMTKKIPADGGNATFGEFLLLAKEVTKYLVIPAASMDWNDVQRRKLVTFSYPLLFHDKFN